ncbi:hypothetical protein B0H11DRAFT_168639 [Mycena galericulata]|nr:hypothetical protein B0H11DRAFT_168639 [Mycena galericulata]
MFSSVKFAAVVLAFSAAAQAISNLQAPATATSGKSITVTWSSVSSDTEPVTLALYSKNPDWNGPFSIVNNIKPQDNKATFTLPDAVPGDDYTIALISMHDTSDILATSAPFSIAPAPSAPPPAKSTAPAHFSTHPAAAASSSAGHASSAASASRASVSASLSAASASASQRASSVTAPLPSLSLSFPVHSSLASATASASSVRSATATATAPLSGVPAPTTTTAQKGSAAAPARVPAAGLALVALLVGAWAV